MREKSLKWMIGSLVIIAVLITGIWLGVHALKPKMAVSQTVSSQAQNEPTSLSSESQTPNTENTSENVLNEPTPYETYQQPATGQATDRIIAETMPESGKQQGKTDEELLREYIAGMRLWDGQKAGDPTKRKL